MRSSNKNKYNLIELILFPEDVAKLVQKSLYLSFCVLHSNHPLGSNQLYIHDPLLVTQENPLPTQSTCKFKLFKFTFYIYIISVFVGSIINLLGVTLACMLIVNNHTI